MTNKPIIIDGVDVSKCKYFDCDSKECKAEYYVRYGYEIVEYDSCRKNKNCYYKQLQREKQECQQAMDNYVQLDLQRVKEYNELVDLYKAKEQECEELKSDLTDLSKIIDCKNGTILTFEEQLDRLKQTLAEIKEICNEYQKEYILNIGVEILTNKILQII